MTKNPENVISGKAAGAGELKTGNKSSSVDHHPYFTWMIAFTPAGIDFRYLKDPVSVTGYTAKEAADLGRIVHDDDRSFFKSGIDELIKNGGDSELSREYRIKRRDGSICWVSEVIKTEKFKNGKLKAVSGYAHDITRIKNNHHIILSDLEGLKELNASKDKFISILSHDLRAPFTSILGFAEILLNEPHLSVRERSEYLQYIHESSQHQLQLINYLLDWSRLQTGRIKPVPERVNLSMVIFNAVSSLTGNAIRKGIDIKADVSEKLHVMADERLLSQAVSNLLSNAVKFSESDSKVEVSADIFNEQYVEVVIKDSGVGIPEENQQKLFKFELMFTTEGTKGEKGTGLGLPLVKEIIDKHNGTIWFYSSQNTGSEFHFTVPLHRNSILYISEHGKESKKTTEFINESYPFYKVDNAQNSFEAIKHIMNELPSLIILHHEIPLMDGIQFIEHLKKEIKNFGVPFIILIRELSKEAQQRYYSLGASAVFPVPPDYSQLSRHIESILQI